MVETGGSTESSGGHGKRDFGGSKAEAVVIICKAWQDQGKVEGGYYRQKRLEARSRKFVYWDRYR